MSVSRLWGGRCRHPLLTVCPALTRCAAAVRPQGRSGWALLGVHMPLPGFGIQLGSPAGPWVPGGGSGGLGAACGHVCAHMMDVHACALCGLGACAWSCVSVAPRAAGGAGVSVHICVCTPGAAQGLHACVTRKCVCISARCACGCTAGAVWSVHMCVTCVCQYLLCLCVDGTRRAGLPVSLCRVCACVLVRVAVLGCACALIPIPGGSVAPGCPWRSPPLVQCWPMVCLRGPWGAPCAAAPPDPPSP